MSPQPTSSLPTTADRRGRAPTTAMATKRESECLAAAFDTLDASDAALLIQVIAKAVELERRHGEDVALAMLNSAMVHGGEGRKLH